MKPLIIFLDTDSICTKDLFFKARNGARGLADLKKEIILIDENSGDRSHAHFIVIDQPRQIQIGPVQERYLIRAELIADTRAWLGGHNVKEREMIVSTYSPFHPQSLRGQLYSLFLDLEEKEAVLV